MFIKSTELPVEKDFASGLAKAIKNYGSYQCIIGGDVYSFYKNYHDLQDFIKQSLADYDSLCSVAVSFADDDYDGPLG